MSYRIIYSPEAKDNLRELSVRDQRIIIAWVDIQLPYEPERPTINRKQMKPNKLDLRWELRIGKFRVFYRVDGKDVIISLVGEKRGNEVYIGKEKLEL